MALNVLQEEASIVLVGSFNPFIFYPSWLINHGLVHDHNYEELNPNFNSAVTPHQTSIQLPNNLILSADRERLVIKTLDPSSSVFLGDLAVGILRKLPETPVAKMGLNLTYDLHGFTPENWRALGDKLAPHDIWKRVLGKSPDWDPTEESAKFGLAHMSFELPIENHPTATLFAKIGVSPRGPSFRAQGRKEVLELACNNHFDFEVTPIPSPVQIVEEEWELRQNTSRQVMEYLMATTIGEAF